MAKSKDILKDKYFEVKIKSRPLPKTRVLYIQNLIGTKDMGKDGLISIEKHIKLSLSDIFGNDYSDSNIISVKEISETNDVCLIIKTLDFS